MTLAKILDQWAENLSKKAAEKDTPLQESTDAFKAVTAYFAVQQKRAKKTDDDEPETGGAFTFAGAEEVVHGERQYPQVRARRNS